MFTNDHYKQNVHKMIITMKTIKMRRNSGYAFKILMKKSQEKKKSLIRVNQNPILLVQSVSIQILRLGQPQFRQST